MPRVPNPSSRLFVAVHRTQSPPKRSWPVPTTLTGAAGRFLSVKSGNTESTGKEKVVVLGSGWAGFNVARRLDPKKYDVVVVSPRSYFVFTPLLASTAVGTLEYRTALEPVRQKCSSNVSLLQGWADTINFRGKTVSVEEAVMDPLQAQAPTKTPHKNPAEPVSDHEGHIEKKKGKLFDVNYDKLVIATGCYMQTFGTPGVREHAMFLKDIGDARKIRNRLLVCFEKAALPTTSKAMKKSLLNFVVVGGGPTGIEFSAELHDIIAEDLVKLYPGLKTEWKITVYDVASKVLPMFDKKLAEYATRAFDREGITIKTSHHVENLRRGLPIDDPEKDDNDADSCWTLKVKEDGEIAAGMVVWSTGLMMNPLVSESLKQSFSLPPARIQSEMPSTKEDLPWQVEKSPKTGAILTNERLQVLVSTQSQTEEHQTRVLKDVYALGDCAATKDVAYPATAQVANQQADWLSKRLNKGDIERQAFSWRNMGTMAYLGNWNAIMQTSSGGVSGRAAWIVWRGAYLTKSVSVRNKILILIYWILNWLFGRDISRF